MYVCIGKAMYRMLKVALIYYSKLSKELIYTGLS